MKRVLILLTVSSALWLPVSAGAMPAQGLSMNVLFFDGKSGYVQLPPNIFDHLTQGTVEAWVKWERFNKHSRVFDFGRKKNAALVQNDKKSDTIMFTILDRRGKRHRIKEKDGIRLNVWHHIAAVFGPGGMKLFIAGKFIKRDKYEGGLDVVGGGQNYIGKSNFPNDRLFQGYVAEFRVWSRRLSKREINQRKDRLLKGNEPGLVAYWPLNDIDGSSAPDSGPGGHGAALAGGVEMRAVPAIARFLIPGEVEKEAEVHYQAAANAFDLGDFESAADTYLESLSYVADYKDAQERAERAQELADLAAAKQEYSEGKAYLDQEDYVPAYRAFDAALKRVQDYEDATALRKLAITRARYKVGLFVFYPTIVERDALAEADKPKPSKWHRFKKWIEEPDDDLLKKADERHRLEESVYIEIVRGLNDRPAHIQLVPNHEVNGIVKEQGFNPEAATEEEVIQAARKSDIPIILIAGLSEAYLDFHESKKKKEANTVKKVEYTDEKGKKKKRDEYKKGYRYYVYEKKVRTKCMLPYQIIDTRTGVVMKDGVLSVEDGDRVKFVNWNNYDDVGPDQLRVKDGEKFKRLASSDRKLFDARMKLKGKWDMLFKASKQMGSELSGKLLEILETHNPRRPFGNGRD